MRVRVCACVHSYLFVCLSVYECLCIRMCTLGTYVSVHELHSNSQYALLPTSVSFQLLWTKFGLRSLAKNDPFYNKVCAYVHIGMCMSSRSM